MARNIFFSSPPVDSPSKNPNILVPKTCILHFPATQTTSIINNNPHLLKSPPLPFRRYNSIDVAATGTLLKSTSVWGFWDRNDEITNAFGGGSSHTYWDYSGTSLAAAQVAGLAGLLKSFRPKLTHVEIKETIVDNAILMSSLYLKCKSGGRISAERALNFQRFFGVYEITSTLLGLSSILVEAVDNNPLPGGRMHLQSAAVQNFGVRVWDRT